jgi:hypothetical protein
MADASDLEQTRDVLRRHKDELLRRDGAVGVGIGRGEGNQGYAIVVHLADARSRPRDRVVVEDVPVRFEVTGNFTPLARRGASRGGI